LGILKPSPEFDVARKAIAEIAARFPSLHMIEEPEAPVELSVRIPAQAGLAHDVWLGLQNNDELHFSVGNFWLAWVPCSKPSRVSDYVTAVSGFLSGEFRVLEHYHGNRCVKAQLQAPSNAGWRTVGTWSTIFALLPWRESLREVRNAQPIIPPDLSRQAAPGR